MSRFVTVAWPTHQCLRSAMTRLNLATELQQSTAVAATAPKKSSQRINAFSLFRKDFYDKHKNKEDAPFTTFAKASHNWNAMTDDQKAIWKRKSEEILSQNTDVAGNKTKQKRPPTAYSLFQKDFYAKHKHEDDVPSATFAKATYTWKTMSEAQRMPWQTKLEELFPKEVVTKTKKKRMLTGYQLYMKEGMLARPDTRSMQEHFKMTSQQWPNLPDDEKQYYNEKAKEQSPES